MRTEFSSFQAFSLSFSVDYFHPFYSSIQRQFIDLFQPFYNVLLLFP